MAMIQKSEFNGNTFTWNLPSAKYIEIKIYNSASVTGGLSTAVKIGIGVGAALGVGGAIIAVPYVIAGMSAASSAAAVGSIGTASGTAAVGGAAAAGSVGTVSLTAIGSAAGAGSVGTASGAAIGGAAVSGSVVAASGAAMGGAAAASTAGAGGFLASMSASVGRSALGRMVSSSAKAVAASYATSLCGAAVAGVGATGYGTASAVGAATAGAVGVVIAGGVEINITIEDLEKTFKSYMKQRYEIVSFNDLENIITDLNLNFEGDLKEAYVRVTGRNNEGFITYEEFLRIFGVKLLKGQELENKLREEFENMANYVGKEISLEQVEKMLKSFGVSVSMSDIEASYAFVTRNEDEYVKTSSGSITLGTFLKMCDCGQNRKLDLEKLIIFYERCKKKDGKVDMRDLCRSLPAISSDIDIPLGSSFHISFEEYLDFYYIGLEFEPLKVVLIFKLSLLYFDFVKLASNDNTISVSDAQDVLKTRGEESLFQTKFLMESSAVEEQGKRNYLNFFEFLELFGKYIDYRKTLRSTDYITNPVRYINTWQFFKYLEKLNVNLDSEDVLKVFNALQGVIGNEPLRYLNYFEFLKVLLVLDMTAGDILQQLENDFGVH